MENIGNRPIPIPIPIVPWKLLQLNSLPQILHLYGYFPSWTSKTDSNLQLFCLFLLMLPLVIHFRNIFMAGNNINLHSKGFFPSWTLKLPLKLFIREKAFWMPTTQPQIQLNLVTQICNFSWHLTNANWYYKVKFVFNKYAVTTPE